MDAIVGCNRSGASSDDYLSRFTFTQTTNLFFETVALTGHPVTEKGFKPDPILIDGRFRIATFLNAFIHCPGATVIFDDYTDRPQYKVVESILSPKKFVGRIATFKIPKHPSRKTLLRTYKMMLDNSQNYL